MGWAKWAIKSLSNNEIVTIKPRGNSMLPYIKSGDRVVISPDTGSIKKGDIVLATVKGRDYLHFVKRIDDNGRYMIANAKGRENGWTKANPWRFY